MRESCTRCGGPLDFAGFDRQKQRVLSCQNSLFYAADGKHDSKACNLVGEFVIGGKTFKSVNWLAREPEGRRR